LIAPQAALAFDRLCFNAAAIAVYGSSGFITWAAPKRLGASLANASHAPIATAGLLAVLATLAWLPLEAATSGESWRSAVDGDTLSALLFDTGIGKAWLVRLALSLLLLAILLWRSAGLMRLAVSALLLASLALTGHARIDQGLRGVLHMLIDSVHLLSGGAWLGALVMLPVCLARLRDPLFGADARSTLRRFSAAGHLAVALVIATGVINTILTLQRWPTDFTSTYQFLLAAKIVLVLTMIGLALINRYVLVPRRMTRWLRNSTFAELALGAGALALVATFGLLDPA
jgi:copper resistance protein D